MAESSASRPRLRSVLYVVLMVLFFIVGTAVLGYPIFRLLYWILHGFGVLHSFPIGAIAGLSFGLPIIVVVLMFAAMKYASHHLTVIILHFVTVYLVICVCLLPFTILLEIPNNLQPDDVTYEHYLSLAVIGLVLIYVIAGVVAGLFVRFKYIKIQTSKIDSPLRIVQISDVHIGSHLMSSFSSIVKRINSLHPDIVCITGDLLDSANVTELYPLTSSSAASSLKLTEQQCQEFGLDKSYAEVAPHKNLVDLNKIESKYGVYYVTVCPLTSSVMFSFSLHLGQS